MPRIVLNFNNFDCNFFKAYSLCVLHVEEQQMEDEVIEIYKDAKVTVNRQNIKKMDVQAAHRIGKKGVVIVKVVNRKFIRAALINGNNLAIKDMETKRPCF